MLDNTLWGSVSGAPKEPSVPLPHIPEERNAEPLPLILAGQQHAPAAREFRPLARMLLALHGGKARPQEHGMLAVLGVQPVDGVIDAAHPFGPQGLPEEIELRIPSPRRSESTTPVAR